MSVNIGSSHALYTSLEKHRRKYNSGVLTVGHINVHIPQNPGTLHSMVTRNSRRIQSTIQEFMKNSASRNRLVIYSTGVCVCTNMAALAL